MGDTDKTENSESTPSTVDKKKTLLIVGLIVAVVVLIVITIILAVSGKGAVITGGAAALAAAAAAAAAKTTRDSTRTKVDETRKGIAGTTEEIKDNHDTANTEMHNVPAEVGGMTDEDKVREGNDLFGGGDGT
jgi:flagellar basal body-associated protein FliL